MRSDFQLDILAALGDSKTDSYSVLEKYLGRIHTDYRVNLFRYLAVWIEHGSIFF